MIAKARRNAGTASLRFRVDDAACFCLRCSERFDLVLLVGALEHMADPAATLAGAKHVLATKGRLVVVMPHPWGLVFRLTQLLAGGHDDPPARHFSPVQLRTMARCQGLELAAIQGLPYMRWTTLAGLSRCTQFSTRAARCKLFTGVLRGAFAAEFHHRNQTAAGSESGEKRCPTGARTLEKALRQP